MSEELRFVLVIIIAIFGGLTLIGWAFLPLLIAHYGRKVCDRLDAIKKGQAPEDKQSKGIAIHPGYREGPPTKRGPDTLNTADH